MGKTEVVIYIDPSCLVKVFLPDPPGSGHILEALEQETAVIISPLTELEALVQFKGRYLGGEYNLAHWRMLEARLTALRNQPPYEFRTISSNLFRTAFRQHRNSQKVHCRSLDRLHLAAMEELGLTRLMTHDSGQAKAAREAGFDVTQPGRD